MPDSLWPHGLQHSRPPCPSPSPGVCPSSCPLRWWCHPAISSSWMPSSHSAHNLSQYQGLFQWVSCSHQMTKILVLQHQSFQYIYSGFISFKIDWFDLLAVQGTPRSLLQHHSLKASILWHSAFFMVQLSQPCMTTGKTITLIVGTFVSRVIIKAFSRNRIQRKQAS